MELLFIFALVILFARNVYTENFYKDVDISWGGDRVKIFGDGNLLTLSLDEASGSGFRSKEEYVFGIFNIQMKLVKGNSAGTVTTHYLSSFSTDTKHDEIDFEFLGNLSGQPYIVHTNIIIDGKGDREQQFYLWYDPTTDFHNYYILWNSKNVIFYIDGTPIRIFEQQKSKGVPYLDNPMRHCGSHWNASDWATQGGLVKPDWRFAPFIASFRNSKVNACIFSKGISSCNNTPLPPWFSRGLDSKGQERLKLFQKSYMVYDYCLDTKRFPKGLPRECTLT